MPVPVPEDMVPASAAIHGRGASYTSGIDIFLFFIQKIAAPPGRKKTIRWIDTFASTTGIDIRKKNTLESNGLDTERPFSVSYFTGNSIEGDFLFVLPVKNGKIFPYKFVDIIRRNAGTKKKIDLNPAITRYGTHSMFQLQKDIFFSTYEQYFLLSSSGPLLKNALDCASRKGGSESLAEEKGFKNFTRDLGNTSQVFLYTCKGISLTDKLSPFIKHSSEKDEEDTDWTAGAPKESVPLLESNGMGIIKRGNTYTCTIISKLNTGNPAADILRNSIQAHNTDKCIFYNNFLFYSYLSIKPKFLHRFCEDDRNKDTALCSGFQEFSDLLLKYTNLIVEKDFVNSFDGTSNIVVKKSSLQGYPDHFVMYFSMKDRQSSETFWNTMKEYLEDSEDIGYTFTEKAIGTTPSFTVTNTQGTTTIYANSGNGFFISNNTELLGKMIEERKKTLTDICDTISGRKIDSGTFSYTSVDLERDSFIKAILLLSSYSSNRLLYNIINNTLKMEIAGKIDRNTIIFDIDLHVKNSATGTPHNQ